MDIQICIQGETPKYSSGDAVVGKVHIYCAQSTTISNFTAALIGESVSSLSGASGLLFSRRQEETHTFLREEHCILSSLRTSKLREIRPIRLDVGCNSFDFRLRVPWAQVCSSCPPNTPVKHDCDQNCINDKLMQSSRRQLLPSTSGLQTGNKVAYRVDVAVTTMRNRFKSRAIKVCQFPSHASLI